MADTDVRRLIAETLTACHTNGLCPLDGPCEACDCFDPQHRYERDHAVAVVAALAEASLEIRPKLPEGSVVVAASELAKLSNDRHRAETEVVDMRDERDVYRSATQAAEAELGDWKHNIAQRAFVAPDADLGTVLESLNAKARDYAAAAQAEAELREIKSGEAVVVAAEDVATVLNPPVDPMQLFDAKARLREVLTAGENAFFSPGRAALPVTEED